jgi:hypothetical protein
MNQARLDALYLPVSNVPVERKISCPDLIHQAMGGDHVAKSIRKYRRMTARFFESPADCLADLRTGLNAPPLDGAPSE